jgi:IstB-like ATP binding protein
LRRQGSRAGCGPTGPEPEEPVALEYAIDVIAIDEAGCVPLADVGAELLFQIIADRMERAALILTTNLPFSEWTQAIPNARLCKAVPDRITDRAHIIDTGHDSYRFRRTLEKPEERLTQDQEAVDAAGPVDAQNAPTGPWITADGNPQPPPSSGYVKR